MIFRQFVFSLMPALVLGSMRYVIDQRSCSPTELFDKVKFWMESAKTRAALATSIIKPYLDDPNGSPLSDRVKNKAELLFGDSTWATMFNLYSRYDEIQKFVWVDTDVWSVDWEKERDFQDVQIHCNTDYIVDDSANPEPNINWRDSVQNLPVKDGDALFDLRNPKSTTSAITAPAQPDQDGQQWPDSSPEVIVWHPEYLKIALRDSVIFNTDRINKAINNSLKDRIKDKFKRVFADFTNIDILDTPEAVMLHELTHLMVPGHSDDTNYPKSYGWVRCVKLKTIKNADSISFFALALDLIENHNVDVDEKGKLSRFT